MIVFLLGLKPSAGFAFKRSFQTSRKEIKKTAGIQTNIEHSKCRNISVCVPKQVHTLKKSHSKSDTAAFHTNIQTETKALTKG